MSVALAASLLAASAIGCAGRLSKPAINRGIEITLVPDEERPLELEVDLVIRSHLARVVDYSDLCHKGVVIVRSADGEEQRSVPGLTWRGTYQMGPHEVAVVGIHLPSHFYLVGGSEYTVHWELAKLRSNEWRFTVPQEGYPTGEPLELGRRDSGPPSATTPEPEHIISITEDSQ